MSGLSKHFGATQVLDKVSFDVRPGEVHGLLGQNGSGKSTLIKILAGFHAPDSGALLEVGGRRVEFPLPAGDFRNLGIAFVHQHLGLVPSMTVLENLLIGEHAARAKWRIDWRGRARHAEALFRRFGLTLDPAAPVARISSVERALLAIVRAFEQIQNTPEASTRLLILDEPTPFLPADDVKRLFQLVRSIVAEGASVVFVSHDIDEVSEITDRITILRDGQLAGSLETRSASKAAIIEAIVGRAVDLSALQRPARPETPQVMSVKGLSGAGVSNLSFDVRAGEVLGLTGLIGSGYDDIVQLCYGARRAQSGELHLGNDRLGLGENSPHRSVRKGIVLIPADRLTEGIASTLSITDNVTLPVLHRFRQGPRLSRKLMRQLAAELNESMDVRPRNPDLLMRALSGGNQQKVVLAKWFQLNPKVVLLAEPTQGVDVGAREQVFTQIHKMAEGGAAVLCASADHEQLAAICDRVLVLARGRIVAELTGSAISKAAIAEACYLTQAPDQRAS